MPRYVRVLINVFKREGMLVLGLVLWPMFGFWLWQSSHDELALIDHAQVVPATLISVGTSRPDPRSGDGGGAEGRYSYRMVDGTEGQISHTYDTLDDIPGNGNDDVLQVEYLPEKPNVKRVKGSGNSSVGEWKFWLAFKYALLSFLFLFSAWVTVTTIRDVKSDYS